MKKSTKRNPLFEELQKEEINKKKVEKYLEFLNEKKISLTTLKDKSGKTAMHHLCTSKGITTEMIELLIEKKATFENEDENKKKPIHFLMNNKKINQEILSSLLKLNVSVNSKDNFSKNSFHYFCENKSLNFSLLNFFLASFKPLINYKVDDNLIPLHLVLMNKNVDLSILKCLHSFSADFQRVDKNERNIAHYYVKNQNGKKKIKIKKNRKYKNIKIKKKK